MSQHHWSGYDERVEYDRGRRDGDWWSSSWQPPSHEPEPYQDGYRDGHRAHEERREEERQEEAREERRAAVHRAERRAQEDAYEAEYYAQQEEPPQPDFVEEQCAGDGHPPYPERPFPRCYCGKVLWLREVTA